MPRSRCQQSPLAAVFSLVGTLILAGVLLTLGPSIASFAARSVFTTPEPSGVGWTPADAQSCVETAQALAGWPDDKGGPVTRIGLGMSDNVVEARVIAVQASVDFAKKADRLRAPGAEVQLAALRAEFMSAAEAIGQPITVTEFRAHYRAIGKATLALTTQCHAVGRWVQDHYKQ